MKDEILKQVGFNLTEAENNLSRDHRLIKINPNSNYTSSAGLTMADQEIQTLDINSGLQVRPRNIETDMNQQSYKTIEPEQKRSFLQARVTRNPGDAQYLN